MKKKSVKRIVVPVILSSSMLLFSACGNDASVSEKKETQTTAASETENSGCTVSFHDNYEGAADPQTQSVESGSAAVQPENPERSGYQFTGWYTDADCTQAADFEVAITGDTDFYAGWEKTSAVVTFDPNYDGAEASTEEVEAGGTASTPATPTREGYLFTAWYTDPENTEAYDFSNAVEDDITLYAGWEADDGNNYTVTYMWNKEDKGEYDSTKVKKLGYAAAPEISLDGCYLEGWYTDEECTQKFDFATTRIKGDTTLYAHWLNVYTFEAEYTDLSGLEGMGYSGNASGTKMIEDGESRNASNGKYVGWLYNEGLTLTFNVTSDAAVDDAKLALRLSAEYYDITLTDSNYTVAVNGNKVAYSDISFTGTDTAELPFADYVLDSEVSLNEGSNVITLTVTNNEKKTGTLYATAPMVDCLYIYSDSDVEWDQGFPLTDNVK